MTRNFLISTSSSSSSTLHPSGLRAGHPARPSTALHFAPPPLLRRTQIYFKIFLPSRSSCGFLRNSGISKQISVPRWSSNLKFMRFRIEKLDQGQSSPRPAPSHDLQTLVQRDLRFLYIYLIKSSSSFPVP